MIGSSRIETSSRHLASCRLLEPERPFFKVPGGWRFLLRVRPVFVGGRRVDDNLLFGLFRFGAGHVIDVVRVV